MINDGKFGMKLFEKYRNRIYAVDGSNLAINPAAELRKVEKFLHFKDNYFSNIRYDTLGIFPNSSSGISLFILLTFFDLSIRLIINSLKIGSVNGTMGSIAYEKILV